MARTWLQPGRNAASASGTLKDLAERHGKALTAVAREWKAADARCLTWVTPTMGMETGGFERIAQDERAEQRWLVGDSYDKIVVYLLGRVPTRLCDELLKFWDRLFRRSRDPRAFWRASWADAASTLKLKVWACAEREERRQNGRRKDGPVLTRGGDVREARREPTLVILDDGNYTVRLRGNTIGLTVEQWAFVSRVAGGKGAYVKVLGSRRDRIKKALPAKLCNLIRSRSGPGGGYRIDPKHLT